MSKKKTHEEYVEELSNKFPNVEVSETYVDSKTKIFHRCKIHDELWEVAPQDVLRGRGCPQCAIEKIRIKNTKSMDKYEEELRINNPNVIVLESYISAKTKIKHKCLIHNIIWEIAPQDALRGAGCVKCWRERQGSPKRKSKEQYIQELSIKNPDVILLGEYQNNHTKTLHRCLKHNYDWEIIPSSVLNGNGCPICSRERKSSSKYKSHDDYKLELELATPYYSVIEQYQGCDTAILHKCDIHQQYFTVDPLHALRGQGCPECSIEKKLLAGRKTNEQYIEDVKRINPKIIPIEKYVTAATPILHQCLDLGHIWKARPNNILSGCGCPKCLRSLGEEQIKKWLDSHNIKNESQFRFNDCRDSRPLPFDFYLPLQNKCIEYDGKQHYESVDYFGGEETFQQRILHDKIKTDYCKEKGIPLLRIPYDANIEEELNKFLLN